MLRDMCSFEPRSIYPVAYPAMAPSLGKMCLVFPFLLKVDTQSMKTAHSLLLKQSGSCFLTQLSGHSSLAEQIRNGWKVLGLIICFCS